MKETRLMAGLLFLSCQGGEAGAAPLAATAGLVESAALVAAAALAALAVSASLLAVAALVDMAELAVSAASVAALVAVAVLALLLVPPRLAGDGAQPLMRFDDAAFVALDSLERIDLAAGLTQLLRAIREDTPAVAEVQRRAAQWRAEHRYPALARRLDSMARQLLRKRRQGPVPNMFNHLEEKQ